MKQGYLTVQVWLYQNNILKDSYIDELVDLIPNYYSFNPVPNYTNYFKYTWIVSPQLLNGNCIENILQHPTKHSPNPDISYILPNKHCGNIKPIDNEHKLLKQPHILSK